MDSTHLHLVLNHFPVVGTLLGIGFMAFGYFTRSTTVRKAALINWVIMAGLAIPVFLTGEPAEEAVEHLPGVSEAIIHEHEASAEIAIWVMEALGILSLIALLVPARNASASNFASAVALSVSLLAFGMMARTGYLGGQIRHSEIRDVAAAAERNGGAETAEEEEED